MPDSKTRIEENKTLYQRQKNFDALKNGLIKKYVEDALDLKDRQQQSIFKITDTRADDYTLSSGYFHACTAFGKTYLMMAMAEGYHAAKTDKKIIIFEENTSVLEQVKQDFMEKTSFRESDIGAFYGEEKNLNTPIIVCTYASMEKMIDEVGKENIGMVLCDEAHHGLSNKRQELIKTTFNGACLYGFTGTPEYNANKTCKDLFAVEIDNVDIKEGVNEGLLCSVKNGLMVSRIPVDLTDCKSTSGDYDDKKLMAAIEKASHQKGIRESLAEFYLNATDEDIGKIYGKTTLINVPNQAEADKLAEVFNKMAKKTIAKAYHTNSGDAPLKEFNNGEFPVLIQVNRLSEGYSNPKIEVCVNYPTASLVRETQCSGRALRADKTNPNKMALVLDIVFKKEDGSDVYEQIAQNGQVIFKDVAEDVCILSPELQHSATPTARNSNKQDSSQISDDMLFDVITDYEDLFKLALEHEENLDEAFIPDKKDNDIGSYDFINKYQVRDKDGYELINKQKELLFNQLIQDEALVIAGIIERRKASNGKILPFIIGDKIAEFNQISGYVIKDKDNTIPFKQDYDIGFTDFTKNYQVHGKDGKELTVKQKEKLFNRLIQDEALIAACIVAKRKISKGRVLPFILGDKIAEFNKISGYIITNKDKDDTISLKQDNDIGYNDFIKSYQVRDKDGTQVAYEQKKKLFNQLIKDQTLIDIGIIAKRKTNQGQIFPFIIGNKIAEFNKISSYVIKDKSDSIPQKQDNDIGNTDFTEKYKVRDKNGNEMVNKQKQQLFNQFIQDEMLIATGIVERRRASNGKILPFIIGDKIAEFNQISGYTIITPLEQLQELQEKAATAQTPAEKNKYLTQAKKLFEKLNPKLKEQNLCATCLEKISGKHK